MRIVYGVEFHEFGETWDAWRTGDEDSYDNREAMYRFTDTLYRLDLNDAEWT